MRDARPYLVPPKGAVLFGEWTGSDDEPLDILAANWDPASDLCIRRTVLIDLRMVRAATSIPDHVPLRLTTTWRSSTSRIVKRAGSSTVAGPGPQVVEAVLPGREIGGSLRVVTTLTVGADWPAPAGVAAWSGCVLADDELRLAVEGEAPQFPLEVVDFASAGWDADASWHLTVKDEMTAPFLGAVWLSLNSRDRDLLKAIEAPKKSAQQQAILEGMYADVGDQLLEAAEVAERSAGLSANDWPDDSLGSALKVLIEHRGQVPPVSAPPVVGEAADHRTARQGVVRRMGLGRGFS